jgi:hypothetical protein
MITLRVWFAMFCVGMLLAGASLWIAVRPVLAFSLPAASTTIIDSVGQSAPTADQPRIDLYGNDVQDAVGDYRVDPRGDLYENHSPDTEVIYLSPPTM